MFNSSITQATFQALGSHIWPVSYPPGRLNIKVKASLRLIPSLATPLLANTHRRTWTYMVWVTEQRPDSEAPRKRRSGEGSGKVWRAEPTGADPEKPGAALCDYLALLH